MTTSTGARASTTLTLRAGAYSWRVQVGQTLRLGRLPSNDVVVVGERVSRFHARLRWDGDQPLLEDLGSLNGTFLGGVKIHGSTPLTDADRIRIGGSVFEVGLPAQRQAPPALLAEVEEELALFGEKQRERRGNTRSQPAFHRLLLDLEAEERTGALRLAQQGHVACLTFCLGKIVGARFQGHAGLAAVAKVFQITRASYRFSADFEASETAVCVSPREYLRQGHWATAKRQRAEVLRRLTTAG